MKIFKTLSFFFITVSVLNSLAHAEQKLSAWSAPDWGFVRPAEQILEPVKISSLKNSLIFDQPFDLDRIHSAGTNVTESKPQKVFRGLNAYNLAPKPVHIDNSPAQIQPPKKLPVPTTKTPVLATVSEPRVKPLAPPQALTLDSSEVQLGSPMGPNWMRPQIERGHLVIVDEEKFSMGDTFPVQGAEVFWIGLESGLKTQSNKNGVALVPKQITHSSRFIVKAQGYLPAVGYAWAQAMTPVVLYRENRIPGVAQTVLKPITDKVQSFPYPQATTLFGKYLSTDGRPLKGIWMDTLLEDPHRVFYSLGQLGVFHPSPKVTGPLGDFLVSGLKWGYRRLMPTQVAEENSRNNLEPVEAVMETRVFPTHFVDVSGMGSVATTTLVEGKKANFQTEVVDHASYEFPEGQRVLVNLGGDINSPSEQGSFDFESHFLRPSVEQVEITSLSHKKILLNVTFDPKTFPDQVVLFTDRDLYKLFQDVSSEINLSRPLVIGNLRPENDREFKVEVLDSRGKTIQELPTFYFDETEDSAAYINRELKHSDGYSQSFIIGNLVPGEYHLRLRDARTGIVFATQVVRTNIDAITFTQF